MKKTRVAINGFGRIGRAFFRAAYGNEHFEIVAVNDLGDLENLAYLLKYDTVYGGLPFDVSYEAGKMRVDGTAMNCLSIRDPKELPWKDLNVDIVVEATGVFASYEKAKVHLESGAKRVVVSAPIKDDPETAGVQGATVLMGVNDDALKTCQISSNASCTTNAASPLIAILKDSVGVEKALLNTIHAYTATQSLVDGPNKKDFRKGRAAAQNIIPSTTGAAIATTKAHTELEGKFDGISMRVPVPVGSLVDITFVAKKDTTAEKINDILREAAASPAWSPRFAVTEEPIVSSDIVGAGFGAIADLSFTRVVGGNLVKVLGWYDNESGYTQTLVEHVETVSKHV
ncbi:type I glyceraldehyde-3-phosphate dehydrogenase [Candidatus Kaiserbacteria bacterium]|nr:type I glyceraldehyde-3-phosphate dehydrogenase [Candidatus Kaiserbacteria bacterium]